MITRFILKRSVLYKQIRVCVYVF